MNEYIQQVNEFIPYNSVIFIYNGLVSFALFKLISPLKECERHYFIPVLCSRFRVQHGIPTWMII